MRFLFKIISILFLSVWFSGAYAQSQTGSPFITNYYLTGVVIDPQNWDIEQSADNLMLFANRRGVLTFDGSEWTFIETKDIPYVIKREADKERIFVGCRSDLGYLYKNDRGIYNYKSLKKPAQVMGNISSIEVLPEHVVFYSDLAVYQFSLSDINDSKMWRSNSESRFRGMVRFKDRILVNEENIGLQWLEKDTLIPIAGGDRLKNTHIIFSLQYDNDNALIGTEEDKLYLFDGKGFKDFQSEANEYVFQNVLSGGAILEGGKIAFSTLTGGCVIINKKDGTIDNIITYRSGIPDDELYAIGLDRDGGLWLAHEFGLSRVDQTLPVENYSSFPGLEGNLNTAVSFNNTIYVATSEGVYYLSEVKSREEVQLLAEAMEKPVEPIDVGPDASGMMREMMQGGPGGAPGGVPGGMPGGKKLTKEELKQQKKDERRKKRKGFFDNLFGSKDESGEDEEGSDEQEEQEQKPKIKNEPSGLELGPTSPTEIKAPGASKSRAKITAPVPSAQLSRKKTDSTPTILVVKKLFKKIDGLKEKSKQMVPYGDKLLVATNTGLYQIRGNTVATIIKEKYINYIYNAGGDLFYVGTADGLMSIEWQGGWKTTTYENVKMPIYSIFKDSENNLWLGTDDIIFRMSLSADEKENPIKQYSLNTRYSERILVSNCGDKPCFLTASGVYQFNPDDDSISAIKSTEEMQQFNRYILLQNKAAWHNNGREWQFLTGNGTTPPINMRYLELFDNIQSIYLDEEENLWIIDNGTALYRIENKENAAHGDLNVFLKSISNSAGYNFTLNNLILDFDEASLTFKMSAPYFIKSGATEFQYIIEGLMHDWSQWTNETKKEFPYLPSGNYTLKIKARNIFGVESEIQEYKFVVKPPFYRTWYFFVGCTLVLAGLVYLFIRLREAQLRQQQVELEEKVKVRTAELAEQKEKTEELLLNILPRETAEELKSKGYASTKYYNMVSVLFTDFVGFTKIAEGMQPEELVSELDEIFQKFDSVIEKYSLEKIKTIGDSYMCAGGIPVKADSNPVLVTLAAMEMLDYMNERAQSKSANGQLPWSIRIGIHTGPLTAGVVGKKKFAYDIWGDTVNTASRMESSGEPGEINVSNTTYELIKPYFECEYRGKKDAKNKGKIDMYFVKSIKAQYAADEAGRLPNDKLKEVLAENNS